MQVETYECEETAAETIEASEEALALVEELGLDGQKTLLCPPKAGDTARRCPYPEATVEQIRVFSLVCPIRFALTLYSRCPMPLRVLQVASHATALGIFDRLEIWDHPSQDTKDPILVAHTRPQYQSDNKIHFLARWGDTLDEWPALVRIAKRTNHELQLRDMRSKQKRAAAEVASLEAMKPEDLPLDYSVYI